MRLFLSLSTHRRILPPFLPLVPDAIMLTLNEMSTTNQRPGNLWLFLSFSHLIFFFLNVFLFFFDYFSSQVLFFSSEDRRNLLVFFTTYNDDKEDDDNDTSFPGSFWTTVCVLGDPWKGPRNSYFHKQIPDWLSRHYVTARETPEKHLGQWRSWRQVWMC